MERKIGIFKGISFEDYCKIDAVNNSSLAELERSPAHYYERHVSPNREIKAATPAMILGNAIHTAVLEPEKFEEKYAIAPKVDRRTKAGKETWEEFTAKNLGKILLSEDDGIVCERIAEGVLKSSVASTLLTGGNAEVTLLWVDPDTGLYCKARCDYLALNEDEGGIAVIADLKSTQDARPHEFARSIAKYSYQRQAAHYTEGLRVLGYPNAMFIFIAVETDTPYASAFYYPDLEMLRQGNVERSVFMKLLRDCRLENSWPGYIESLQQISLPKWKTKNDGSPNAEKELETF